MKKLLVVAAIFTLMLAACSYNSKYAASMSLGVLPIKDVTEMLWIKSVVTSMKKADPLNDKAKEYISKTLENMSIDEKLSQMMILTNPKDVTAVNISRYQPGGVIYFSLDFNGKTVEDVKERTESLQKNSNIPMLVGVDEEGGDVSRIAGLREPDAPSFLGARDLWKDESVVAVARDTIDKTEYLKQMGINLNFGPVADVTDKNVAYMYNRSAGDTGESVSEYVKNVLKVMKEEDMVSCIKHFPGYGNNANTHMLYTIDSRELSEYEENDFLPFEAGIKQGTDMVMVSHIVMKAVDGDNPASLSREVHRLLRDDLGYDGVIISDDLNMKAILSKLTMEQASGAAVLAGNDMIFSADYNASLKGLRKLYDTGELTEDQIDESVTKILKMKIRRHIIDI